MRLIHRCIISLLLFVPLFAQDVSVTATVDSQSIVIGDWINLSVEVNHPSSLHSVFPSLKDTLGVFDIVRQDSLTKIEKDGIAALSKKIVISKYIAGNFYVPPVVVQFTDASGNIRTAQSNPIPIQVRGIEVDTTQAIRDVKPPLTVPMTAEEIALYAGIILAIAAAAYGIYYYLKRRKQKVVIVEEDIPNIPPHVRALLELDELEAKRLWQSGEIKLFYSQATEIVRRYFELRYGIMALEMTTGEVMNQLGEFNLDDTIVASIYEFLSDADLVKFAKYRPMAADNEHVIVQAREIVEQTKPVEVEQMKEPKTVAV